MVFALLAKLIIIFIRMLALNRIRVHQALQLLLFQRILLRRILGKCRDLWSLHWVMCHMLTYRWVLMLDMHCRVILNIVHFFFSYYAESYSCVTTVSCTETSDYYYYNIKDYDTDKRCRLWNCGNWTDDFLIRT